MVDTRTTSYSHAHKPSKPLFPGIDYEQLPAFDIPDATRRNTSAHSASSPTHQASQTTKLSDYIDFTHSSTVAIQQSDITRRIHTTTFADIAHGLRAFPPDNRLGMIRHELRYPSQPHQHDYYEITYVLSGDIAMWIHGTTLLLHAGDLCAIARNIPHTIAPLSPEISLAQNSAKTRSSVHNTSTHNTSVHNIDVAVTSELLEQCLAGTHAPAHDIFNGLDFVHIPAKNHPQLRTVIAGLTKSFCTPSHASLASSDSPNSSLHYPADTKDYHPHKYTLSLSTLRYVYGLLDTVDTVSHQKTSSDRILDQLAYATQQSLHTARPQTLANALGYSVGYLSRYVKKHTGMSLGSFILGIKLDFCTTLLISTALPMSAIAEQAGFASMGYFYKTFKEKFGLSPLHYRKTFEG